ncbi:DUF4188 domain-containing protein [Paenibacillus pasadenensis]|uniref:DUF4188 domain-containing protein n=1 Tax=Paenibacillus TaxID=44249 RepID=UPI000422C007|nr:DUF4188 domain-containing protein [Paenibacillus pasadenensis]
MTQIYPGRFTAEMEGSFVVFIIGMRINKLLAVHKWLPVAKAMPPMLKELHQHPELGFISHELLLGARGVTTIQYWRTYEQLERYARQGQHLEAWQRFNRAVGNDGTVGVFHETYLIEPGCSESIYVNMPRTLLAKAGSHMPVGKGRHDSRERLKADKGLN